MTDRQFLNQLIETFFVEKDGKVALRESKILNEGAMKELIVDEVQKYAQKRFDSREVVEKWT